MKVGVRFTVQKLNGAELPGVLELVVEEGIHRAGARRPLPFAFRRPTGQASRGRRKIRTRQSPWGSGSAATSKPSPTATRTSGRGSKVAYASNPSSGASPRRGP